MSEDQQSNMSHSDLVFTRLKQPIDIFNQFDIEKANLVHLVLGLVGEAGELLDAIKKNYAYNKPLDIENVKEELGDIEFYLEGLRQHLGFTREEILEHNLNKLLIRYRQGYTDHEASNRRDKNG
jgi:NTP pyrophosphatase (non-canonical NTP hydrolase)